MQDKKHPLPYSLTIKALSDLGPEQIPTELRTDTQLIYNSPAALDFNSPGAQGFGVKRAGLAVPGSIMMLIAPAAAGATQKRCRLPADTERALRISCCQKMIL